MVITTPQSSHSVYAKGINPNIVQVSIQKRQITLEKVKKPHAGVTRSRPECSIAFSSALTQYDDDKHFIPYVTTGHTICTKVICIILSWNPMEEIMYCKQCFWASSLSGHYFILVTSYNRINMSCGMHY